MHGSDNQRHASLSTSTLMYYPVRFRLPAGVPYTIRVRNLSQTLLVRHSLVPLSHRDFADPPEGVELLPLS
jgi:hypothetical protein